jgi:hypothetical protein
VGARRILIHEGTPESCRVTAARTIKIGDTIDIGREGELPIGVTVPSGAISRLAVTVTATPRGWNVVAANRNGLLIHPWGQAPLRAESHNTLNWPLVGLRTLPDTASSQHWVLMEADDLPVDPTGAIAERGVIRTDLVDPPADLTPAEREALTIVFEQQLRWPPVHPAQPLLLKQAGVRLGITISGLHDRLKAARARALRLGHTPLAGLTDPGYLYALVRAGYLAPPNDFPHRPASAPTAR